MKTNTTNFAKTSIAWAALLASGMGIVTDAAASENITSAKEKRGLSPIILAMFIPDMPALPPQSSPIVMLAQTNQAQLSTKKAERVLGVCEVIANEERKDKNGEIYPNAIDISPIWDAITYFQHYDHRNDFNSDYDIAKVVILSQPKHGTLVQDTMPPILKGRYFYTPDAGYVGKDSAEILVEIKGIKVKVRYFVHATEYREPDAYEYNCTEAPTNPWKISTLPATQQGNPALAAILANASLSFAGFADFGNNRGPRFC